MMIQSARIIFLHPQNESFNNCIVNKSRPTYELINSRQFLYRQTQKAVEALDEAFDR
jgi:hypothetical protein